MKKIFLIGFALMASFFVFIMSMQHSLIGPHLINKEFEEKGDARGMIEYFEKIMVDPATRKFDLKAYYSSLQYANEVKALRSNNNLGLQWQFLGPDNVGGRTRAILFDKNTSFKIFAAGVSGGLWISNDDGQSWAAWSGSDDLPNMNIVSICQDANGNIYFGTGEGLYTNYGIFGGGFPGDGMWKSTDDGSTFVHLNSTTPIDTFDPGADWSEVNRIAANPRSPDSVIAATEGGLELSGNGGSTWTRAIALKLSAEDVKFSIDGKKVFAALKGDLYYSNNGGASFTNISGTNGFPASFGIERIEIAVSPTSANYAYATLVNSSDLSVAYVVQTKDGGNSWSIIGTGTGFSGNAFTSNGFDPTGDQGDYDLAMAVSPLDSTDLFVGGTTLWRWTPALGWSQISIYGSTFNNGLHADIHALIFDPANSSRLLIGCDGGVNQTLDPYNTNSTGVLFSPLNVNYDVTQFYSIAADSNGRVQGGTQDNGTNYVNFLGNSAQSATQIMGGDGGTSTISLSNNLAFFDQTPYGNVERSSDGGNNFDPFYDSNSGTAVGEVGAQFVTPYCLWENPDSIPVDRISNNPIQSLFAVGFNSGEVWVTAQAINFGTSPVWFPLQKLSSGDVTATTFSADGNFLYVGTDAGVIYRYSGLNQMFAKNKWRYSLIADTFAFSKWNPGDSGINLTASSFTGFAGRTVLSIAIDPNNPNHVVVTCGNYGTNYSTWIAQSNNATDTSAAGFTFSSIQGIGNNALPNAPIYSACIPHKGNSDIIVGTPLGVWTSLDNGVTWAPDNNGLANVVTMSIKELPYFGDYALYAGTHGRGMFTSRTLTTGINILQKPSVVNNLSVFPNPTSTNSTIQFNLEKASQVVINLYDIDGNLVKQFANQIMSAGLIKFKFNVSDLVDGTYFIRVNEGNYSSLSKVLVLH